MGRRKDLIRLRKFETKKREEKNGQIRSSVRGLIRRERTVGKILRLINKIGGYSTQSLINGSVDGMPSYRLLLFLHSCSFCCLFILFVLVPHTLRPENAWWSAAYCLTAKLTTQTSSLPTWYNPTSSPLAASSSSSSILYQFSRSQHKCRRHHNHPWLLCDATVTCFLGFCLTDLSLPTLSCLDRPRTGERDRGKVFSSNSRRIRRIVFMVQLIIIL